VRAVPAATVVAMKIFALIAIAAATAGCATARENAATESVPAPYFVNEYGQVARVNSREGYVVLECAVLPKPGERITLHRGKSVSGVVLATRITSGRYAAADIVEGAPMSGDWYRIEKSSQTTARTEP
jgi:hypothetical protein